MKRAPALAFGLVLIAGGCRAIVGIEDLDPPPAQQPPKPDGGDGERGHGDAGGPGPGGGGARDSGLVAMCAQDSQCPRCCKENDQPFRDAFEGTTAGAQCLCKPELGCAKKCTDLGKQCAAPPSGAGAPQPDECLRCTDDLLRLSDDPCVEAACKGNPDCLEGLACFRACKP